MKPLRTILYIIGDEPYKGTNENRKCIYCISKRTQSYREVFLYLGGLKHTSTGTCEYIKKNIGCSASRSWSGELDNWGRQNFIEMAVVTILCA